MNDHDEYLRRREDRKPPDDEGMIVATLFVGLMFVGVLIFCVRACSGL